MYSGCKEQNLCLWGCLGVVEWTEAVKLQVTQRGFYHPSPSCGCCFIISKVYFCGAPNFQSTHVISHSYLNVLVEFYIEQQNSLKQPTSFPCRLLSGCHLLTIFILYYIYIFMSLPLMKLEGDRIQV